MPESIDGIPLHPLFVHAPIILIPLAVITMILWIARPAWRSSTAWNGFALVVVGMTLGSTLLAGESGEELARSVRETASLEEHEELAEMLEAFVWAFAASSLIMIGSSFERVGGVLGGARRTIALLASVAVVVTGIGAVALDVLAGHAGAKSAWAEWTGAPIGEGDED